MTHVLPPLRKLHSNHTMDDKGVTYKSSSNHTDAAAILLHSQSEENIQGSPRRQSSWQTVLAELRGPQRLWTTTLGVVVASLSPLLGGYTLGFASPALLQLNHNHVPTEYRLEGTVLGLFAVSQ